MNELFEKYRQISIEIGKLAGKLDNDLANIGIEKEEIEQVTGGLVLLSDKYNLIAKLRIKREREQ